MDLIYTNASKIDQGVLSAYSLDLAYGANSDENNFEVKLGKNEPSLDDSALIYIEGTEYGGIVDGMKKSSTSEVRAYFGRTWHGILNSKVIAVDYSTSSGIFKGEANKLLADIIYRLSLNDLFTADENDSGVTIKSHQFGSYSLGYDGITKMLSKNGAKLKIAWDAKSRKVRLSAVSIADYTESALDSDVAQLSIERHCNKVNHMICLGRGQQEERWVVHLYVDQFGRIGNKQYFKGSEEYVYIYDNTFCESMEDLISMGETKLNELLNKDKAEIDFAESETALFDVGDIVAATDLQTGIGVSSAVTSKIVRINNGVISTEYKTGGQ